MFFPKYLRNKSLMSEVSILGRTGTFYARLMINYNATRFNVNMLTPNHYKIPLYSWKLYLKYEK